LSSLEQSKSAVEVKKEQNNNKQGNIIQINIEFSNKDNINKLPMQFYHKIQI